MTEKKVKAINGFLSAFEKERLENMHKLADEYNIKDLEQIFRDSF